VDIQTFLEDMVAAGMDLDRVEELLLIDLEEGGPVFGKFLRSLSGAAASAVSAAERQGEIAGQISDDETLRRLLRLEEMDLSQAIDSADAEALELIGQNAAEHMRFTWICSLVNTCDRCLPLHGTTMFMDQFEARGWVPEAMHPGSWTSSCECQLVPDDLVERGEEIAPLTRKRVKSATGLKGVKRTQRQVAQLDPEKSRVAVVAARKTKQGRRTLRLMGQAKAQGAEQ
jgi:hypothetical protein